MTLWVYLHSFSHCWLPNLRDPAKFQVTDLGVNRKCVCDFLLVISSNFGRISYRFRDIDVYS